MDESGAIHNCKIHPSIGVARVGNSPDQFFLGPESPGVAPAPNGGFKDAEGRVKRQAARFRIYGYDADGRVVRELTAADATISWTVQLSNRKGSCTRFHSEQQTSEAATEGRPLPLRNAGIVDTPAAPAARRALEIDPGPRSISGVSTAGEGYRFDGGAFLGVPVALGELRTDEQGRLLVLGGAGSAGAVVPQRAISDDNDNDLWWDDTADGPVSACVTLADGSELPVSGAWLLVAPPDFSPHTTNLVTLYDVMREVSYQQGWLAPPQTVSFTRDIYPLLARLAGYQWVSGRALRGHGPGRPGDFTAPATLAKLADASDAHAKERAAVFGMLRDPQSTDPTRANRSVMPPLAGESGPPQQGDLASWLSLQPHQYSLLKAWAAGEFVADWSGEPVPPAVASLPVAEQPAALDRAALEACVGGGFYPGVEMSYLARDPALYTEPFRLCETLPPGEITRWLPVPWQANLFARSPDWWPAQRPDDVIAEQDYLRALRDFSAEAAHQYLRVTLLDLVPWSRGIGTQRHYDGPAAFAGHNDMVSRWSQLGIVQRRVTASGEALYVECERAPFALLKDREHYYYLLNIESYPEFLPAARALAEELLAEIRRHQDSPNLATVLRSFPYSPEALDARLDEIYNLLVNAANRPGPPTDGICKSREDAVARILQASPFNQLDGIWLRNITAGGPIDAVQSLLAEIWWEESGAGEPVQNHANLATRLLNELGILTPDPHSRAYADDPSFLDAAFTLPIFELSLSQFSRQYFPELLGFTLQEEWEVLENLPFIKLARHFGIPSQFFEIHVGIDNAESGHGAKAKRAVQLYLEHVNAEGGDAAVQEAWQRVWTGFNAMAASGTLMRDLVLKFAKRHTHHDEMIAMIERKRAYGSLNHGHAAIGGTRINDLFDDPEGFLAALTASPLIAPGKPDESTLFSLFTNAGPMFGVFTPAERKLWADWIRSLGDQPQGAAAPAQAASDADLARQMAALLDALRPSLRGAAFAGKEQLVGPDPFRPEALVSQPPDWWLQQSSPSLLRALVRAENKLIAAGDAANSPLVAILSSASPAATAVLGASLPGAAGVCGDDIVRRWIDGGCPLPPDLPRQRMSMTMHADVLNGLPPSYLRGMGAVH